MHLKNLLDAELMQIIFAKRLNGLHKVLIDEEKGVEHDTLSESAHGKEDAGGIFLPGYLIQENGEGDYLPEETTGKPLTQTEFTKRIEKGINGDGATLIYKDHIENGMGIPTYLNKHAKQMSQISAMQRNGSGRKQKYTFDALMNAFIPRLLLRDTDLNKYTGTKKKITCALAMILNDPSSYLHMKEIKGHLDHPLSYKAFKNSLTQAQEPISSDTGMLLAHPHIIACDSGRYFSRNINALTRIYNITPENYGEFATLTFESGNTLMRTNPSPKLNPANAVCFSDTKEVYGVLRRHKRNKNARLTTMPKCTEVYIIKPEDVNCDFLDEQHRAHEMYQK